MVAQGDIWLLEVPHDKRRPVLVVSRDEAIPALTNVVVAPITRTVRHIPTCVLVGPDQGIDHESVATFDNLTTVPKAYLTTRFGDLGHSGYEAICAAMSALADC